jgi:hypothetical protein
VTKLSAAFCQRETFGNADILQLKNTGVTLDRARQPKCRDSATEEYRSERLYGAAEKVMTNLTPVFMDCRCNAKEGHTIRNSLHRQVGVVVVLCCFHLLWSSKNSLRKVRRSLE